MKKSLILLLTFLPLFVHTGLSATTTCNGVLSGVFDDVIAPGPTCTLNNAEVRGSVSVNSGDLVTQGTTKIFGSITVSSNGESIKLSGSLEVNGDVSITNSPGLSLVTEGTTTISGGIKISSSGGTADLSGSLQVNGDVSVSNSPTLSLAIGSNAKLASLKLERPGSVSLEGTVGGVECKQCGGLSLDGATITGGGLSVELGDGDLSVCSSNISGPINVLESNGAIAVARSSSCGSSTVTGSISVSNGKGSVDVVGATLNGGDVSVQGRNGKIVLKQAKVGDVAVEKNEGSVSLVSVETESDSKCIEINGDLEIDESAFTGDVSISLVGGSVNVTKSSFSLENVEIKNNDGPVNFIDNSDVSVAISENRNVAIRNNTIVEAGVSKNLVGTEITNNQFEKLICSDNNPPPTGSGNTVTVSADGQCAGF